MRLVVQKGVSEGCAEQDAALKEEDWLDPPWGSSETV